MAGLDGKLGSADLTTTNDTLIYDCPDGSEAVVSINLAVRSGTAVVRLALTDGNTTPANDDWLDYDTSISVGDALLREGVAMSAQDRIYARSDTADVVTAIVYGTERAA